MSTGVDVDPATPVAIVLAAGTGSRMGADRPKQLLDLAGRPVLVHAVERHVERGDHVVLVAGRSIRAEVDEVLARHLPEAGVVVVVGGDSRRDSFLAGVDAVPASTGERTGVIVQNAASPNTPPELVAACLARLADADGAQAYLATQLTTFTHADGELRRLHDRERTGATADPTVYRRSLLDRIAATLRAEGERSTGTTLDVARRLGARIAVVESPPDNVKVTTPGDLERVARAMAGRRPAP